MESIEAPDWLVETSFEKLFLRGGAEAVLARPDIISALGAIIESDGVVSTHKVLAHELMLSAGQPGRPDLAPTYCAVLPEGFAHNWWGMPGQYDERLGRALVSFGKAALPCLRALLGDERPLGYFGSEEPTLNAGYGFRVGDLAAHFICEIEGIAYEVFESKDDRDTFNTRLRRDEERSP